MIFSSFAHHPPYIAIALNIPKDPVSFPVKIPHNTPRPSTVLEAERRIRCGNREREREKERKRERERERE